MEAKLDEYFEKEKAEKGFLPQEDFDSCYDRAMAWIEMSYEDSKDLMAADAGYAIAVNRENDHGDDTMEEQAKLLAAGANPEVGTMAFWNN